SISMHYIPSLSLSCLHIPTSSISSHSPSTPHALHSFPTRRSSDLPLFAVKDADPSKHMMNVLRLLGKPSNEDVQRMCMDSKYSRSEEHTSELQSHLNLVCRLLL